MRCHLVTLVFGMLGNSVPHVSQHSLTLITEFSHVKLGWFVKLGFCDDAVLE